MSNFTRRNARNASAHFQDALFPPADGADRALRLRAIAACTDLLGASRQSAETTLVLFAIEEPSQDQARLCDEAVSDWTRLAEAMSHLRDTPSQHVGSQHIETLFCAIIDRLHLARDLLIPVHDSRRVGPLLALETLAVVLGDILCDAFMRHPATVNLGPIDAILMRWATLSDSLHLTNPAQPCLTIARYLRETTGVPRIPGAYDRLIQGFEGIATTRHTVVAALAATACRMTAASMRDEKEGNSPFAVSGFRWILQAALFDSGAHIAPRWSVVKQAGAGFLCMDQHVAIILDDKGAVSSVEARTPRKRFDFASDAAVACMAQFCQDAGVFCGHPRVERVEVEIEHLRRVFLLDDVSDNIDRVDFDGIDDPMSPEGTERYGDNVEDSAPVGREAGQGDIQISSEQGNADNPETAVDLLLSSGNPADRIQGAILWASVRM